MITSLTHGSFPNGDRSSSDQSTDRPGSDSRPEFQFQLVTTEHRELTVNFHRDETIGILKVRILELLQNTGLKEVPVDRQRLLFNNQILQPDNSPIYWIAGIGSDCKIHLVENNPLENNYRSIAQIDDSQRNFADQERPLSEIELENRKKAYLRFNTCRALQRNFHACVDAAQRSQEPNERNRFNEPDGVSPSTPDCRDFGYLIREMANAIQSYSMVMARLSDDLIRDDKVEGKSDPEFSRMRRLLQNSMDGARYLSAELEFVSNFIVPLSSHPRRILEIVSNVPTDGAENFVTNNVP